jgi:hypothetical protein
LRGLRAGGSAARAAQDNGEAHGDDGAGDRSD